MKRCTVQQLRENTCPASFFYQNNLDVGPTDAMVYPQKMIANMITNLANANPGRLRVIAPGEPVTIRTRK